MMINDGHCHHGAARLAADCGLRAYARTVTDESEATRALIKDLHDALDAIVASVRQTAVGRDDRNAAMAALARHGIRPPAIARLARDHLATLNPTDEERQAAGASETTARNAVKYHRPTAD